ncbi:OLC1v1039074C1 [Oldenlandia corymbosa var. corymbosa]|uniref:OLC1v1039074C1 n=1 Tax=Oldenlandia corymbosa var. corymbosa TaxID=529605 RepID=A0AAV1D1Q9_OLDCO|nr:OLC1v1039074C1 [Oldenlandia corymbosa var. corymbosa]
MFGSGMNLITTIIGFGMSATFIVFVCTRLICGRIRRMESRQMFEIGTRMDFELPEHRITGLEPTVVAAIPTMKFSQEAFSSAEDTQCTICLGDYEDKEVLRIMPKCGHSFHLTCIDVWLRKQSTCPVCRLSVEESLETKYVQPVMRRTQSFDTPEVSVDQSQHSQVFLLPTNQRSEEHGITESRPDAITIDIEPTQPSVSVGAASSEARS